MQRGQLLHWYDVSSAPMEVVNQREMKERCEKR